MRIILASSVFLLNYFIVHAVKNEEDVEIEKEDSMLEKVERWIRYSLQTGVSFGPGESDNFLPPKIYRSNGLGLFDDFVSGKCFTKIEELDHLPNLKQHLEHLEHHFDAFFDDQRPFGDQRPNWMRSWIIGDNIKYDITEWYLTTQHEPNKPGHLKHYLGASLGDRKADQPNWMRTLSKISDLVGWQHFWAFNTVFQKIASDGAAGDYTKLLEKLLPFSAKLDLLAPRNLPFKAKDKIDMARIEKNLRELGYMQLKNYKLQNEAMKNAYELGQQLSRPILLMSLYRTLHRAIIYDIVSLKCHEGMPRREYVAHWLRKIYDSLKLNYVENRIKFLESLEPKLEYNQQILDLFSEWAKYVFYWDKLLEALEYQKLTDLDPTINLFEPSKL